MHSTGSHLNLALINILQTKVSLPVNCQDLKMFHYSPYFDLTQLQEREMEKFVLKRQNHGVTEYLIKWKNQSYLHCEWVEESRLPLITNYRPWRKKKFDDSCSTDETLDPGLTEVVGLLIHL